MKKEDSVKIIKDKRILACIALLLVLIAAALCAAALKQNAGRRAVGMASLMADRLEQSEFSWLPSERRELEKAAEAAAEFLDELVSMGAGRQEMVDSLQGYLLELGWELTEEQAAELAEWLVDIYLQNYESVYGKPSGVEQTERGISGTYLEEMRTDLENISEYLTRLDASVTGNKEELVSLKEIQNGSYEELTEYLDRMKNVIAAIQTELSEYQNSQSEQQTASGQEFAEMKVRMDGLSQAVLELEERLKESIRSTEGNNGGRYEALEEEIDGLSEELRDKWEALDQRLAAMLADLKADGAGMNAGLSELVSQSQKELSRLLSDLEAANQLRYEQAETGNAGRNEQTNQNINEKVSLLSGKLDQVHTDISAAQAEIEQVLADMGASDSLRMDEIMKSFTGINAALAQINTDMDTAHGELKTLIETVRTEAGENQKELLGVLDRIDTSFTEQNSQNYDALVRSLNSQTEAMKAQLEAMNSSITQNTAQIAAEVSVGSAEILQKLADMESSTNTMLSGLSGDVQSVFQRVSNGKKLLASALLTKNVVIDEDATFQEIHDGILSMEQQIVIGVDKIPGTIEYEYHYHTGSPENGGGCYTVEDVHQHNAGCYQLCTYSWSGCAGNGWTDGNSISHCPYEEKHSICNGGQTMYKTYSHPNHGGSQSGHRSGGSSTHAIPVCGKTEGQNYGWKTGCGLQDGQIIGAHIVYDADAVSEAAAAYEKAAVQDALSFREMMKLMAVPSGTDNAEWPETELPDQPESETEETEAAKETETTEEAESSEETETPEESEEAEKTESPEEAESPTASEETAAGQETEDEMLPEETGMLPEGTEIPPEGTGTPPEGTEMPPEETEMLPEGTETEENEPNPEKPESESENSGTEPEMPKAEPEEAGMDPEEPETDPEEAVPENSVKPEPKNV